MSHVSTVPGLGIDETREKMLTYLLLVSVTVPRVLLDASALYRKTLEQSLVMGAGQRG